MTFWRRLAYLLPWRKAAADREMNEELLALKALASPHELGNLTVAAEDARAAIGWPRLEMAVHDVRYALRSLGRSPGFVAAAVATFALGIGGNTAVFSVAHQLLMTRLAVPMPTELQSLVRVSRGERGESFPYPFLSYLRASERSLGVVAGSASRTASLTVGDTESTAQAELTTADYFSVLGLSATSGRVLSTHDSASASSVAVVSEAFARRSWGEHAVGQLLRVDDVAFTVVGVMPPGFHGMSLDAPADLWLPIQWQPLLDGQSSLDDAHLNWVRLFRRLPHGASGGGTPAALTALLWQYATETGGDPRGAVVALVAADKPVSAARGVLQAPLALMSAIVALVLLVACVNVAYLFQSRAAARQHEFELRLALGAGQGRLMRQVLMETGLLAAAGAFLGIALARGATRWLVSYVATSGGAGLRAPEWLATSVNPAVLGFTLAAACLAALLTGMVPIARARAAQPPSLLALSRTRRVLGKSSPPPRWLIGSQVALSVVLLAIASAFIQGFRSIGRVDLGFRPDGLIVVTPMWASTQSNPQISRVMLEVLDELQSTPNVLAAGLSVPGVFSRSTWQASVTTTDHPGSWLVPVTSASQGYLPTLGVLMRNGRDFDRQDTGSSPLVAILSEAAARLLYPGESAIGRDIRLFGRSDRIRVIGIASDIRLRDVLAPPPPTVYVPIGQGKGPILSSITWTVRSGLPLSSLVPTLNRIIARAQPGAKADVVPVTELIGQSLLVQRLLAMLTGFFGLTGLLLAGVGTFGAMSFQALSRLPEVAVRLALGAEPGQVRRHLYIVAMRPVFAGVAIGAGLAVAASHMASAVFAGLSTAMPSAVPAAAFLQLVVASVSCYVPAWRASRSDPAVVFRET